MLPELWRPSASYQQNTALHGFMTWLAQHQGRSFKTYEQLHAWSVADPGRFWATIWTYCEVQGEIGQQPYMTSAGSMQTTQFFPQARLNYARNVLAAPGKDAADALVAMNEAGRVTRTSWRQLRRHVARLSSQFRDIGLEHGNRVAAILPNVPNAIVAALATSATGAVWSSCSPDFGVRGILDRFGQIEPKILIVVDGYTYGGRLFRIDDKVAEVIASLPTVEHLIIFDNVGHAHEMAKSLPGRLAPGRRLAIEKFEDILDRRSEEEPEFDELPFTHPLYILFSSGTTGVPKCIVHSAGGLLLKHLSEHRLHADLKPGDRLFYFTTLGWMMWNWLVTGLASGATLLLYDGNPFYPDGNCLWSFAEKERITHFGTSAKYIDAMKKAELAPARSHDLPALRSILSTGSPLAPESFDYVYADIKKDVHLASISGGTDICGCFVIGCPTLPVRRGEIQCAALGMDVDVVDENGQSLVGQKGELVCRAPFPSMPIGFWADPDGTRYRAAYFERFPGIWHHGDFAECTPDGGYIIYGRSDATLKPGGVRIGTAEIYRQVEQLPEVLESIAIGQDWQGDVRIVLFVVLQPGHRLDQDLEARIKQQIRSGASPRHVPAKVIQVPDIPRTKSGKLTELAVRDVVHGRTVGNKEALANPEALDLFANLDQLRA